MIESLAAGQAIKCTVLKTPKAAGAVKTIEKLMRQNPVVIRGLARAQHKRDQNLVIYNRGNRDWVKREKCAKIVRVIPGANWKMTFSPVLAKELASVKAYLTIEAA